MSASIDQLSSILLTPLPTRFRHSNIIPRSASESNRAALLFNSHVRMAGVKIMPCYLGIQPPSRFHSRQNGPHARLNLLHRGNSLSVSRPQRDRIHLTHLTSSSHNYPSCQFLTFGAISSQGQGFLIAVKFCCLIFSFFSFFSSFLLCFNLSLFDFGSSLSLTLNSHSFTHSLITIHHCSSTHQLINKAHPTHLHTTQHNTTHHPSIAPSRESRIPSPSPSSSSSFSSIPQLLLHSALPH